MRREERLTEVFVELADTMVDEFDAVDLLHQLVETVVELLDVEAAGLMLVDQRGSLQTLAASDQQVRLLELLELQQEQGPCLDCFDSGEQIVNTDPDEARRRWKVFTEAAIDAGYPMVHALPMRLRGTIVGAINLFCTEPGTLTIEDITVGQALADIGTIALLQERRAEEQTVLVEQLQTALNSRVVIEQAKGVLAERTGMDLSEAFTALRAHARRTRQPLRAVALAVIDGTMHQPPDASLRTAPTEHGDSADRAPTRDGSLPDR